MGRKKPKSPRQAARQALVEQYGHKSNKNANLWFVRCPLTGRDWLFDSDLRVEHFYACESDAEVIRADYTFREVDIVLDGKTTSVRVDARVEVHGGGVELRRVETAAQQLRGLDESREAAIASAVEKLGGRYRLVPVAELDGLTQRILNWRRGYRALRAARLLERLTTESNVRLRLEQRKHVSLAQLLGSLPQEDPALVQAAVFSLHRQRLMTSDLDRNPLGLSTQLRWQGEAP